MAIRASSDDELEATRPVVLERTRESFPYNYLPEKVARLLREASACYSADLFLAFAVLCRRTLAAAHDAGEPSPGSRLRQLYEDAVAVGQVDIETRDMLRDVLFGDFPEPAITPEQAAILIEVIRDMLSQRYVRTAKLRRAIQVRQLFADGARQPD